MNTNPKVGEVVHLNSGSPDLKVVSFCEACKLVGVEWEANGSLSFAHFPLTSVRNVVVDEASIRT